MPPSQQLSHDNNTRWRNPSSDLLTHIVSTKFAKSKKVLNGDHVV